MSAMNNIAAGSLFHRKLPKNSYQSFIQIHDPNVRRPLLVNTHHTEHIYIIKLSVIFHSRMISRLSPAPKDSLPNSTTNLPRHGKSISSAKAQTALFRKPISLDTTTPSSNSSSGTHAHTISRGPRDKHRSFSRLRRNNGREKIPRTHKASSSPLFRSHRHTHTQTPRDHVPHRFPRP